MSGQLHASTFPPPRRRESQLDAVVKGEVIDSVLKRISTFLILICKVYVFSKIKVLFAGR
jgi:hypothetical protein